MNLVCPSCQNLLNPFDLSRLRQTVMILVSRLLTEGLLVLNSPIAARYPDCFGSQLLAVVWVAASQERLHLAVERKPLFPGSDSIGIAARMAPRAQSSGPINGLGLGTPLSVIGVCASHDPDTDSAVCPTSIPSRYRSVPFVTLLWVGLSVRQLLFGPNVVHASLLCERGLFRCSFNRSEDVDTITSQRSSSVSDGFNSRNIVFCRCELRFCSIRACRWMALAVPTLRRNARCDGDVSYPFGF
jgi:hypothetical protein